MAAAWPVATLGQVIELQGSDKTLRLSVRLAGTTGGPRGETAFLGQELRYDARVQNISSNSLRIPVPDECLDVALTRKTANMFVTTGGSRVREVATLAPGQELKFSGQFTLLHTNVCYFRVSFHNSRTQQIKRVLVPRGEAAEKSRMMVPAMLEVPITNVWTGRISLSRELDTSGYLAGDLRTQYGIAMRKALFFEQGAQPMTNFNPAANGRLKLDHGNVTQQSEAVSLVGRVGADANSAAVDWLWECFEKSRKNSPVHVAAMAELYGLLTKGIGYENADRFLGIAKADATEEAIVTRLYAMDAASLFCIREHLACDLKGNRFISRITPEIQKRARETLVVLTKDRLRDIHTRAKRLLGIPVPVKSGGTRKYIKPAAEKPWTPDDDPPK